MIIDFQRGIISGLIYETFIPDEINERMRICEELLPKYKDLFTNEQLQILRIVYHDAKRFNQDGAVAFGLSEISEKIITKKMPYLVDEMLEILEKRPIVESMIPAYLEELEKQTLMMEM